MKSIPPLILAATITAIGALNAQAESYGINFLGSTNDAVTGTAGVVPIGNWNNFGTGAFSYTANASTGMLTTTLTISGPGAGNGYRTVGTPPNTGGNASLEDGYFDAGGNGGQGATGTGTAAVTFTLTGLASAAYNIYIYDAGDAGRPGNIGDGLPNYTVNGTDLFTSNLGGAFNGFVQGQTQPTELTSYPSTLTPGNYILVSGVVPANGTITIIANNDNRTFRSPVDGFELVSAAVPEPSTYAFMLMGVLGMGMAARTRLRQRSSVE